MERRHYATFHPHGIFRYSTIVNKLRIFAFWQQFDQTPRCFFQASTAKLFIVATFYHHILCQCPVDRTILTSEYSQAKSQSNSVHGVKSANWQFLKCHFWPRAWKLNFFLWPNTFIWSVMNVPLLNFFHNVSQFLPNPEFVSILGKKVIFSKGHPYSISILVS